MTQNEILTQCMHEMIADDETKNFFYGPAYTSLMKTVSIDEPASRFRANVHTEL